MFKKFEVGYDGELIGVYRAETTEGAIRECREQIRDAQYTPETPVQQRLLGLIAVEV